MKPTQEEIPKPHFFNSKKTEKEENKIGNFKVGFKKTEKINSLISDNPHEPPNIEPVRIIKDAPLIYQKETAPSTEYSDNKNFREGQNNFKDQGPRNDFQNNRNKDFNRKKESGDDQREEQEFRGYNKKQDNFNSGYQKNEKSWNNNKYEGQQNRDNTEWDHKKIYQPEEGSRQNKEYDDKPHNNFKRGGFNQQKDFHPRNNDWKNNENPKKEWQQNRGIQSSTTVPAYNLPVSSNQETNPKQIERNEPVRQGENNRKGYEGEKFTKANDRNRQQNFSARDNRLDNTGPGYQKNQSNQEEQPYKNSKPKYSEDATNFNHANKEKIREETGDEVDTKKQEYVKQGDNQPGKFNNRGHGNRNPRNNNNQNGRFQNKNTQQSKKQDQEYYQSKNRKKSNEEDDEVYVPKPSKAKSSDDDNDDSDKEPRRKTDYGNNIFRVFADNKH